MIVFMAGLRTRRLPTCPASQLQIEPVPLGRSFLLTAAGQLRIFTGFPSSPCAGAQRTIKFPNYILRSVNPQALHLVEKMCFTTAWQSVYLNSTGTKKTGRATSRLGVGFIRVLPSPICRGVKPPKDGFGQRVAGFGQLFGPFHC